MNLSGKGKKRLKSRAELDNAKVREYRDSEDFLSRYLLLSLRNLDDQAQLVIDDRFCDPRVRRCLRCLRRVSRRSEIFP